MYVHVYMSTCLQGGAAWSRRSSPVTSPTRQPLQPLQPLQAFPRRHAPPFPSPAPAAREQAGGRAPGAGGGDWLHHGLAEGLGVGRFASRKDTVGALEVWDHCALGELM